MQSILPWLTQSMNLCDMQACADCRVHASIRSRWQVVRFLLEAFRTASRPKEELVQAVRLLVLPMLEASYDAGQAVVDDAMLQAMVTDMFDPPDELAGASPQTE